MRDAMLYAIVLAAMPAWFEALAQPAPSPSLSTWRIAPDITPRLRYLLQKKYELPPDTELEFIEGTAGPDFKRLVVRSKAPGRPFEKNVYITLNDRFVLEPIGELGPNARALDLMEARQLADQVRMDNSPRLGNSSTAVTVVVYADYQCRYCREAHAILTGRTRRDKQFQVLFRHHPLGNHQWARAAARSAICIYQQSNDMFWAFSDFIFEHQRDIALDNVPAKVAEFIKSSPAISQEKFAQCEASTAPDYALLMDENTGFANAVNATPTFFINGIKLVGLGDGESDLMRIVDQAEAELTDTKTHTHATPRNPSH